MATSPLFGWEEPDDVDLVKDGAAAIRTLGNAIDTSMGDLLGGTTGQVLSKASNTNMDFTWVTSDDANAIQNAIVDAKGDLIAATAADTPARLAVGTNGQVLTADSTASTGLAWATPASTGGMTLLSTTTLSGSSTTISSISQSYNNLQVYVTGLTVSTAAEVYFKINNAANQYQYFLNAQTTTVGQQAANVATLTGGATMDQASSGGNGNWNIEFNNYASGTRFQYTGGGVFYKPSWTSYWFAGGFESTSAMTSLVFSLTAGTFSAGTVKIYGVK